MLGMVKQGLRDMEDPNDNRALFGFCGVVVFGRSVTLALQNLRTFDAVAFNKWYGPWEQEMRADPLLRFFYKLRTQLLHDIDPPILVVVAGYGHGVRLGSIRIDLPLPETHLGESGCPLARGSRGDPLVADGIAERSNEASRSTGQLRTSEGSRLPASARRRQDTMATSCVAAGFVYGRV